MKQTQGKIDEKIVEYLERAGRILSKKHWTTEQDSIANYSQIEIAKMIQLESHWQAEWGFTDPEVVNNIKGNYNE